MIVYGNTFVEFRGVVKHSEGVDEDTGDRVGLSFTASITVLADDPGILTPGEQAVALKHIRTNVDNVISVEITQVETLH